MHPECGWEDKFFWEHSYELLAFYISPSIELTEDFLDDWYDTLVQNYYCHEMVWTVPDGDTVGFETIIKTDCFELEEDGFYEMETV